MESNEGLLLGWWSGFLPVVRNTTKPGFVPGFVLGRGPIRIGPGLTMAEREGFEPPVELSPTVVFKTTAFSHSATSPFSPP